MDASPLGTVLASPATRRSSLPGSAAGPATPTPASSPAAPAQAFLERVHARHRDLDGRRGRELHPGARARGPGLVRDRAGDRRRHRLPGRRQRGCRSRSSRSRSRFTYGLVLDDLGRAAVRRRIGVEPTGDAFNAITLAPGSGVPLNPMVNAGAIAAASLVAPADGVPALDRIARRCSARLAGRPLAIDPVVFESERETGHRNRAIAHLLRASGTLADDPDVALERYFAPVLGRGRCPRARDDGRDARQWRRQPADRRAGAFRADRPVGPERHGHLRHVRLVGRLDLHGRPPGQERRVGRDHGGACPASSGSRSTRRRWMRAGTASAASRPAATSPATSTCTWSGGAGPARRRSGRGTPSRASHPSGRRADAERAQLDIAGWQAEVLDLQGDLTFLAVETAIRGLEDPGRRTALGRARPRPGRARRARGDHDPRRSRGGAAGRGSRPVRLRAARRTRRRSTRSTPGSRRPGDPRSIGSPTPTTPASGARTGSSMPRHRPVRPTPTTTDARPAHRPAPRASCSTACDRATPPPSAAAWNGAATPRARSIVRHGDPAHELFLLTSGRLSVTVERVGGGGPRRLTTQSAGTIFGELAFVARTTRTADVHADTRWSARSCARTRSTS